MAVATGVGSMPGEDMAEAVRVVFGELPDLPHVPELPARGALATITGRTLAMVAELGFDLQPAGWRLTDAPGVDHRRARSLLAQDLDVVEELAQEYVGPLKLQVAGPWTLAATVERPRGDRLLADVGARRELAEALALGVAQHIGDMRRRVPGASLIVQVDEPALPAVLGGGVPTASGFHRHRSVDEPRASAALERVFEAVRESGATTVGHCCAADAPVALLRRAGADAVSIDLGVVGPAAYEPLGQALDAGQRVFLGVVPSSGEALASATPAHDSGRKIGSDVALAARRARDAARRFLNMLGFEADTVDAQLVLTPACGLAAASPPYAREALAVVREAAATLSG